MRFILDIRFSFHLWLEKTGHFVVQKSKLLVQFHKALFYSAAAYPGFVKDPGVWNSWFNPCVPDRGHVPHTSAWEGSSDGLPHGDTQLVSDGEVAVSSDSPAGQLVQGNVQAVVSCPHVCVSQCLGFLWNAGLLEFLWTQSGSVTLAVHDRVLNSCFKIHDHCTLKRSSIDHSLWEFCKFSVPCIIENFHHSRLISTLAVLVGAHHKSHVPGPLFGEAAPPGLR